MRSGKMFSAMDLLWFFLLQVWLREQDVPYTAFSTPGGLFEYLVTPMGLLCSLAALNRLIQSVFVDQSAFCKAYFDDLFVFTPSDDVDEHLEAFERVLERCKQEQLYIELAKCTFCAKEVPCLGDFIGAEGIRMDPDKVRTIKNWPLPWTKHDVQSFIGTCVYVQWHGVENADSLEPESNLVQAQGLIDAFKARQTLTGPITSLQASQEDRYATS
ncbi:hypothetical protein PI124_g857 [Phytophthora idaei]|nr:hypothetical protein PI124_g857 [Phytophthora idaei]